MRIILKIHYIIIATIMISITIGCHTPQTHPATPCEPCKPCPELSPITKTEVIIDSDISLEEALAGLEIPENIKNEMTIIDIKYIGYDSLRHRGQMVCNRSVAGDLSLIFEHLFRDSFPIEKIVPVSKYDWSDSLSMADNNTSCFNFRLVSGGHSLSQHSLGRAVDINPRNNPYFRRNDTSGLPLNGIYDTLQPGTIKPHSNVTKYFKQYGWHWGGSWRGYKDYQHFSRFGG